MNNFQITALQYPQFYNLFKLNDEELKDVGAVRMTVDKKPGFPCRVSLQDAEIGEEVILLPYQHHQCNSPYQAKGAIFVRKNALTAALGVNDIPKMLDHRLLSIRAYNESGMMKEAHVSEGKSIKDVLIKTFTNKEISYVHIHNAKQGCYHCCAERVD